MDISNKNKKALLKLARNSIENFLDSGIELLHLSNDEIFNSKSGAFVTLKKHNELRGCIGYITSIRPLKETVKNAAIFAASEDPRFIPVRFNELAEIEIEISVLSEPFPMKNYDEIEIGKHGVILESPNRALLLPQVPIEHNMNRDEYLSALCNKADLPSNY